MKRETFICSCESIDHQVHFFWDDELNELYCEVHLSPYKNLFNRVLHAIRYVFGLRTRTSSFDTVIFKGEDVERLRDFLNRSPKINSSD